MLSNCWLDWLMIDGYCNGITGDRLKEIGWKLVLFIILYCSLNGINYSLNGIYRFKPSKEVVFCKVISVKYKHFTA